MADVAQVLESFAARVATASAGIRPALERLCDLYALSTVEADRAWFLEHGRLSNARAKAVTAQVNELNRRVRPIAQQLVDAFGVPREMLRSELLEFSGS